MEIKQEWKQIRDLNYEASIHGEIRNLKTGRIIKQRVSTDGYLITDIQINKKNKTFKTHRLIAETFYGIPDEGLQVDHINRIKTDNRVENLRWVTIKENLENRFFGVSEDTIKKIISLHSEGKTISEIFNKIN